MKSMADGYGYNDRLFSGGIRRFLHLARFHWFSSQLSRLDLEPDSVLELGCFDGKLIDYLPKGPSKYVGFDANWEGGLDVAKEQRGDLSNCFFFEATSPEHMHLESNDVFQVAVAMETLEHVPPELVGGYLKKIAQHLDGYLFVTVPNEKGILFLAKWIAKTVLSKDGKTYTFAELVNATFGRMDRVARNNHKGFDYQLMVREIGEYFDVLEVSGHPLGFLPTPLCFGIGIVAKTKTVHC